MNGSLTNSSVSKVKKNSILPVIFHGGRQFSKNQTKSGNFHRRISIL